MGIYVEGIYCEMVNFVSEIFECKELNIYVSIIVNWFVFYGVVGRFIKKIFYRNES